MQDGNTMRNNYGCDLDALGTGARIGMMRTAKGDLHYFINGQDQGAACSGLPPGKGDCSGFQPAPLAQIHQGLRLLMPSLLHRGVCRSGSLWPVCPSVYHQCYWPHGQQPGNQQHCH